MHVHFEELVTTRSDCTIQTLSWMGKVPDGAPDEDGWKLNRQHYYQEGWLSMGNVKGIVSATFTTCHCKNSFEKPPRTNFNLRGHKNEVILVKWNEPYQKLATCDGNGVIFVWIKHEGRWSVELINDRNSPVTDFAWSHDGRMALICYQDGFVLVGSVAGQRYWSTMLNLESATICTGVWAPNDQRVLFGTSDGHIIVMSSTGTMLAHEAVLEGAEISTMCFSCEKFYMDEQDSDSDNEEHHRDPLDTQTLAVCFRHGVIYLMSGYDDLCPKVITTGLTGLRIEWTNDGELLAVGGFIRQPNLECCSYVQFYTQQGTLRCSVRVPSQGKPLTGLTWGHNDKRLFLATGCYVHVAWVVKSVASLQYLAQRAISGRLKDDGLLSKTSLPPALQQQVASLFSYTIKGNIPSPFKLREFVSLPPPGNDRLHCTMIRQGEETSGGFYTLYLEYLGGLIPLLKGKRASKIRPEFVIYDPKLKFSCRVPCPDVSEYDMFATSSESEDTDSDQDPVIDGCGSPRMRRRRRHKRCRNERVSENKYKTLDELLYDDDLPESHKLVEITSNIWGTKFKMHGLASYLPPDLGHVTYKTSLLHLQPRQMSVTITELSAEMQQCVQQESARASFSPHQFSEDEDDTSLSAHGSERPTILPPVVAPVAPETCLTPSPVAGASGPVLVERHAAFIDDPVDEYFTPVDMKRSSSSEYSIHSHRLQFTREPGASTSSAGAHLGAPLLGGAPIGAPISEETISIEDDSSTTPLVPSASSGSLRGRSRSLELLYEDLKTCVNLVAECAGETKGLENYLKIKRGSLDSKNPVIKYKGDTVRSASVPTTPTKTAKKKLNRGDMVMGKHRIQSPLLQRRFRNIRFENDDESLGSSEDIFTPQHYKDLESFQKAQLKQKLRRARRGSNGFTSGLKQFVMHNKAPLWNENSQVYQLDFGGRVTQESAKNFQIEFRGKQVMQFGRIDSNAYTLDFQYPFTALQAFAVALANVTQRLK